jgi:hypothetical protein
MMAFRFRNILLLALLGPSIAGFGQTDTTLSKEKEPDFVNDKFKERISMFYIAGKTTLETMNYGFAPTIGIYTGYEHKFHSFHAIGAGIGYFGHYQDFGFTPYNSFDDLLRIDLSYKYYHNLNLRMSKGLTGNNFSANYFYVSPGLNIRSLYSRISSSSWDFTHGYWVTTSKREIIYDPRLKIGYGFQRIISNKMNFDLNTGIQISSYMRPYHPEELFYFQVTLGFIIK